MRSQEGRCEFRTKDDAVLMGRKWDEKGGVQVEADEGMYADDTQVLWGSREWVAREAPVLFALFAEFGLEVHVKQPGQTDPSKSVVLFYPKPARCYANKVTFDGVDLTGHRHRQWTQSVTVVEEVKYLGSYAARAGNDLRDVEARIDKASKAFGALKHCLFKSKDVSIEAKRGVYNGLVLAILLFGAEHWCLTAKMVRMLRAFHHRSVRTMCRLTLYHTRRNHVRTSTLLKRLARHPDHRDLHRTTTAAVAWACVADADGTRAKAAANSLAPTEATSGPARAHLWAHSGAYDTGS